MTFPTTAQLAAALVVLAGWIFYREWCLLSERKAFEWGLQSAQEEADKTLKLLVLLTVKRWGVHAPQPFLELEGMRRSDLLGKVCAPYVMDVLDTITRRLTAFVTFQELVDAPAYKLSLRVDTLDAQCLAAYYDAYMKKEGRINRCFRT